MPEIYDLIIRNGTIADGSGGGLFQADIAINGGRIIEVGAVKGRGREEIDAKDKLVTPGFIDLHTHLDGHVTWEERLYPNTGHGITTAIIGNCGVGFAPCRPADREVLIRLMETVEDIRFDDLAKGLPWNWETYPQYLDALAARRFNMDVGTLIPHSTLRAYVMGERCLSGEPASDNDLHLLGSLTEGAIKAGALGFGTSTLQDQKTSEGHHIPSYWATEEEFTAIADGMSRAGSGVFQVAVEFNQFPKACDQLNMFKRVAQHSGRPVMYSLKQTNSTPEGWRQLLEISDQANAEGVVMHPQVLGRPTGAMMGLQTSLNPFSRCPSWVKYVDLSLEDKLTALRQPEVRATLIGEAGQGQMKMPERLRGYKLIFPLNDPPNYEPTAGDSLDSLAQARGISPEELAYELLLENGGRNLMMLAGGNFADFTLDPSLEMIRNPHSVPGLGDGGAHSSIICDVSATTYMLSYWTRDRTRGERLPIPDVVQWLTSTAANAIGLTDRGLIKPGYKADINVIDYDNLYLHAPRPVNDLPAGGTRLVQDVNGYEATIVSGEIIIRNDQVTNALPGRLVRGC